MKKVELQVYAISHSITQTQSYAVVLEEVNGIRKIPIVIGAFEAQAIAVALERMKPPRPLTHDLMKNVMLAFSIDLHEVIIYDLQEAVFYSKMICSNEHDTLEIDSRTSDALALAVRFGCPIYTYESIMDAAGVIMEADGEKPIQEKIENTPATDVGQSDLHSLSTEELQTLLEEVLEQEDYIKAIAIRDEIERRKTS
ncbi:MAG: bifunctional nuclease family protein [Bacteroidetes bacterium]|nr:bifunctional nuclease family protein [Bacteroidota bacterium]